MIQYFNRPKIKFRYLKSNTDTSTIVDMFLSDWLSDVCFSEYDVKDGIMSFEIPEDAMIAKLKGIPPTLTNYMTFDNS